MTEQRYIQVHYPWAATFDSGCAAPCAYLARLIQQTLRYSMPARRYGPLGAWVVRHAMPTRLLTSTLKASSARPRPELDAILQDVSRGWNRLAERSSLLPRRVPAHLCALMLKRRAADTIFVFGEGPEPLIVCKVPRGPATSLENEDAALRQAEPSGIGPLSLGRLGDTFVQQALAGAPLEVEPLSPKSAENLQWKPEHRKLADGLIRLADTTRRPGPPQELSQEVADALDKGDLPKKVLDVARYALRDLRRLDLAVLRHGDTSAQNCLFDKGDLIGLVDWEIARPRGAPGFDTLNTAIALIDHGVGLVRWSEERALESFRAAWRSSAFFDEARAAARAATHAAGGRDEDYERLEVAFFARRLASRVARPTSYVTGARTAARMLEIACAR